MRAVITVEEFVALESQGNPILRKKPNRVLVPPTIFLLASGESDKSKVLAMAIINVIRLKEEDDDKTIEHKEDEAQGMELLLAFL